MPTDLVDLAIIGGGAAGLATAIFAAESAPRSRIVVLDGAPTLGAKILVAGGGRCNVTHDVVTPEDYNAASRNVVRNVLAAFDAEACVRWFASLGVELKREETGKLFPTTDSARTVLNALLNRCSQLGVTVQTRAKVTGVAPPSATSPEDRSDAPTLTAGFTVTHDSGVVRARRVVLATGGRSLPRSGSDGSGWDLARSLGHTVTPTYAALVPLVLDANKSFHAALSGIAQDVELSTFADGKLIDRRTGSLLWTHFGISGPVVMDASRHWTVAQEQSRGPEVRCNFLPGETFESADRWLTTQSSARPRAALATLITARLPERVAIALLTHAGVDPSMAAGQLPRDARRGLVHAMTALPLPVTQHRGWNYAEVTAGGVPLAEVNFRTMESRKVPGLYLAGEIVDCDGRIGGYNFQWAWATGHLAGLAAARETVPPRGPA